MLNIAGDFRLTARQLNELKMAWGQTQEDLVEYDVPQTLSNAVDGSSFLSGPAKKVEMSEILASLPPEPEVDKLVHQFFDRENFGIPVARK